MAGSSEQRGKPSLLDNIEGFFRGIVEGLDEPKPLEAPAETPTDGISREVGRTVQEVRRGDYILRRTTIDEVIYDPRTTDDARAD
jgi:hypothetical protein